MICVECNSNDYDVFINEDDGLEVDAEVLGVETPYCPFCGSDIDLAERGGYEADDE